MHTAYGYRTSHNRALCLNCLTDLYAREPGEIIIIRIESPFRCDWCLEN